ncbi:MAG: rhodanese-like domain-containing protein [Gammaproteobacteria bacterium]|nr:rhodanese-like domain-containing protein [Gammaproteobacteria bacterium]
MSNEFTLVSPAKAAEILSNNPNAVLMDVRSEMEFLMIGHAKGAINNPWIDAPDWEISKDFVARTRKILLGRHTGRDAGRVPLMLMCRSDNRSRDAAEQLVAQGIRDVFVVENGFEGPLNEAHQRSTVAGWRFDGLPWEQC